MKANVPAGNAVAAPLNWGKSAHDAGEAGPVYEMAGSWDFIICSDCVYTKVLISAIIYHLMYIVEFACVALTQRAERQGF